MIGTVNDATNTKIVFGADLHVIGLKPGDLWSAYPLTQHRTTSKRVLGGGQVPKNSLDTRWMFSLHLLRSSETNGKLSTLMMTDFLTKAINLPFLYRELNGVQVIAASGSKIKGWPTVEGFNKLTWSFELYYTKPFFLGKQRWLQQ